MDSNPHDTTAQEAAVQFARDTQGWYDANAAIGGVCDFCADPIIVSGATTWISTPILEVYSILDPETLGTGTAFGVKSQDWAACPKCDPVVALLDPEKLADHVIANPGARAPKLEEHDRVRFRADLVELYERFYAGGVHREERPERKAKPGEVCLVASIPGCDFCRDGTPGPYDFKTAVGPWAHGCELHWHQRRAAPGLGVGKAQLWITEEEE